MKVILSIKPAFAEKILDGTKRFEFRKCGFTSLDVETVVIYATKPVGKVVGEFSIVEVHKDEPSRIWEKTKDHAGINKRFFDEYYQNRDTAYAIAVGTVTKYDEPMELATLGPDITPPQSYRYLRALE
ncbi:ASCH domain-containing protein [Delftia sp. JD2]|uniref:ASCH domain-containing protein n=1 Tax=Delftia sp. JD2 TaxID=469553 RepID=UPI000806835C|nr:ASCH domain-containing protein [Delftia sp. JD2]OBY86656.1 phage associated protein [Delftia sp. JD2]